MGAPMGGFFDGADIVFATLVPFAVTPGVLAETPNLPIEPVPIDNGTYTGKASEALLLLRHTLQKRWSLLLLLFRPRLPLLPYPRSSPPVTLL